MFSKTYTVQGILLEFLFEYSEFGKSKIKTLIFQNKQERTIELSNGVVLKSIPQKGTLEIGYTFTYGIDGGTLINEFLEDLEFQLNVLRTNKMDNEGIGAMISAAISNHINRFRRLIFSDIDVYLNVTMNIIVAHRKAHKLQRLTLEQGLEIKQDYEKQILEVFKDYVYISSSPIDPMAGIPGMPRMPGMSPTLLKLSELKNRTIFILN